MHADWDGEKVQQILSEQEAIVQYHKKEGHRKSHQVCIIVDDFADRPAIVGKRTGGGTLNALARRGRQCESLPKTYRCSPRLIPIQVDTYTYM